MKIFRFILSIILTILSCFFIIKCMKYFDRYAKRVAKRDFCSKCSQALWRCFDRWIPRHRHIWKRYMAWPVMIILYCPLFTVIWVLEILVIYRWMLIIPATASWSLWGCLYWLQARALRLGWRADGAEDNRI